MNDTGFSIPAFIPENETFHLENWKGDIHIPDNLIVHGTLSLINCPNVGSFSDNVLLLGNIILQDSHITRLPENCLVRGNLNLMYSKIAHIPEIIAVTGNLNVFGCRWYEANKHLFIVKGETIGAKL